MNGFDFKRSVSTRLREVAWLALMSLALAATACGKPDPPTISLYRAVQAGDLDQIERHIAWNSDINQLTPDGELPLHTAVRQGRVVITRLLLENGAKINAPDRAGRTPLYVALMHGRTQIVDLLVRQGADFDPHFLLIETARNGVSDRDVYRLLLAKGADVNARDAEGETALVIATRGGYRKTVKQLIRHGADVNLPDAAGNTPLQIALTEQDEDIERLLRQNGASLSADGS
jgi:ankyrin repeat protein